MRKPTWIETASLLIAALSLVVAIWAAWPGPKKRPEIRVYTAGLGAKIIGDRSAESFRLVIGNNGGEVAIIDAVNFECGLGGGDPFTTCSLNFPWLIRSGSLPGRRLEPGKAATALHVDGLGLSSDSRPKESFEQFVQNVRNISVEILYHDEGGAKYSTKWKLLSDK